VTALIREKNDSKGIPHKKEIEKILSKNSLKLGISHKNITTRKNKITLPNLKTKKQKRKFLSG
jgi:hypothetical protein